MFLFVAAAQLKVQVVIAPRGRPALSYFVREWPDVTVYNASYKVGHCNATHSVVYEFNEKLERCADVCMYAHNKNYKKGSLMKLIKEHEPLCGAQMGFSYEPPSGEPDMYDREILKLHAGYRRFDEIYRPWYHRDELWAAGRNSSSGNRSGVGIYVSNCQAKLRTEAIKQLVKSDLLVESYGTCFHNVELKAHHDLALTCRRHQFMLAIENSMYPDYISEKLMNAAKCGAIPIVASLGGVPDYVGVYGDFPRIHLHSHKDVAEKMIPMIRNLSTQPHLWEALMAGWRREPTFDDGLPTNFHCPWFDSPAVQAGRGCRNRHNVTAGSDT